jgi:hypothetical protein
LGPGHRSTANPSGDVDQTTVLDVQQDLVLEGARLVYVDLDGEVDFATGRDEEADVQLTAEATPPLSTQYHADEADGPGVGVGDHEFGGTEGTCGDFLQGRNGDFEVEGVFPRKGGIPPHREGY